MEPDQSLTIRSYRLPLWLNGITWALLVLGGLASLRLWGSYSALTPLLLMLPVAGLGAVANLLFALWCYFKGLNRQADPYLLGCGLLALFFAGHLVYVLVHLPSKFGG